MISYQSLLLSTTVLNDDIVITQFVGEKVSGKHPTS